ncbi:Golgi CORVET complex core vacuolar protein 8-domain-containing protein [Tribonema minus]|uniref:Golgi CORVET complex core vacuolar protein 8-domain-containing protein n=1 Tax=Tribonema minus TaxID=303371 RepID=A0A836CF74_9STRA|nr:Golgi CORVET complex core vacuolar protein 8-domain-containing protein [Tribonema minus]
MALLARGWGRTVQLLAVSLEPPSVEVPDTGQDPSQPPPTAAVRLELVGAVATLSTVVATAWLSASALVYVTADMAAAVYDVRSGMVLETLGMGAPLFMTPLNAAAVVSEALRESLAALLSRYVRLAVDNAPSAAAAAAAAAPPAAAPPRQGEGARGRLAKSHFQMLAGVCAEYCVVTERADVLFGEVLERFKEAGYTQTFLETLEPYVLEERLHTLQSTALREVAEHTLHSGDSQMLERWALHLNAAALAESPGALALLRRRGLYTALLRACGAGAGDYLAALEALLQDAMALADREHAHRAVAEIPRVGSEPETPSAAAPPRDCPYPPDPQLDALGYKALLYLRHCFRGAAFPGGEALGAALLPAVRAQLLYLLFQRAISAGGLRPSMADPPLSPPPPEAPPVWKASPYPYLRILLYIDTPLTLETLAIALDSPEAEFEDGGAAGGPTGVVGGGAGKGAFGEEGMLAAAAMDMRVTVCPARRFILSALSAVLAPGLLSEETAPALQGLQFKDREGRPWPRASCGAFLELAARYLERSLVQALVPGGALRRAASAGPVFHNCVTSLHQMRRDGCCILHSVHRATADAQRTAPGVPVPGTVCGKRRLGLRHSASSRADCFGSFAECSCRMRDALLPLVEKAGYCRAAVAVLRARAHAHGLTQALFVQTLRGFLQTLRGYLQVCHVVQRHRLNVCAYFNSCARAHGLTQALFVQTLRGYLQGAEDDAFRRQAFAFVRNEVRHLAATGGDPKGAVLDALSDLLELDAVLAARAVAEVGATPEEAVAALNGSAHLQFRYLDAVQGAQQGDGDSGDSGGPMLMSVTTLMLLHVPVAAGALLTSSLIFKSHPPLLLTCCYAADLSPVRLLQYLSLLVHYLLLLALLTSSLIFKSQPPLLPVHYCCASDLSPAQLLQYLSLLVRFRPGDVRPHLAAREGLYPLDAALALCKAHGVTDATAYLLERSGDAAGALALTIDALEEQLRVLRRALRASPPAVPPSSAGAHALAELEEGRRAVRSLAAAVDLCQRSGGAASSAAAGDNQAAQAMWFAALDRVVGVKTAAAAGGGDGAAAMAAAADILLQRLLEGMTGYVPLPAIVGKVLSDHAQAPLGEFKGLIQSMLVACSRETDVYRAAAVLLFGCAQRARAARRRLARAGVRVCAIDGRGLDPDTLARVAASRAIVRVRASNGQATTEAVTSAGQHEQTAETAAAAVHVWRLRAWRARAPPPPQLPFAHAPPPPPSPPPPRPENSGAEQGGRASPPAAAGGEGGVGRGWRVRGLLAAAMPQSLSDALGGGSSSGGGSAQQPAADG